MLGVHWLENVRETTTYKNDTKKKQGSLPPLKKEFIIFHTLPRINVFRGIIIFLGGWKCESESFSTGYILALFSGKMIVAQ